MVRLARCCSIEEPFGADLKANATWFVHCQFISGTFVRHYPKLDPLAILVYCCEGKSENPWSLPDFGTDRCANSLLKGKPGKRQASLNCLAEMRFSERAGWCRRKEASIQLSRTAVDLQGSGPTHTHSRQPIRTYMLYIYHMNTYIYIHMYMYMYNYIYIYLYLYLYLYIYIYIYIYIYNIYISIYLYLGLYLYLYLNLYTYIHIHSICDMYIIYIHIVFAQQMHM